MSQIWFITGVSSGLGLEIALAALEAGCNVIGTVRSRQRAVKEVEKIEGKGGKCLEFDVMDAKACGRVYQQALGIYGGIDVLVNNAGMSYLGAVEDFSDDEAKAQMEVNFHGPLRVIQAALPGFREQKKGTIVNITSIAGIDAQASCGLYAASKFAMEGLSEALSREVEEHNIRVLIVEPGAFRTNFLAAFKTPASPTTIENYERVKHVFHHFEEMEGKQPGDATKAAARIVEVVVGKGMAGQFGGKILRLPLGRDCVERFEAKMKSMGDDLGTVREAAFSTDIEG